MMTPVTIIGMGMSPDDLTARHLALIQHADVIVGGRRLLDGFRDLPSEKIEITREIGELIQLITERMQTKSVVVLTSGDPLFFGIGGRMVAALGAERVVVYPNISSVAAAFSRIKEPWHDAEVISLHGRNCEQELKGLLKSARKVAVLTDPKKNPAWIASWLTDNGITGIEMCVLEQLGTSGERVRWFDLASASRTRFSNPNVVILRSGVPQKKQNRHRRLFLGMPETSYAREGGLITKAEVRAVSLSKLRLSAGQVLWDLGAGSGSVGLEASLLLGDGKIVAVEKERSRIAQIEENKRHYGVGRLETVRADLPEGLERLPDPDRVFIGGGGKKVAAIVAAAAGRLGSGGRIVINTVLISSVDGVLNALKRMGFETGLTQVQVSRGREMPWGARLEALNPVWIISGEKP